MQNEHPVKHSPDDMLLRVIRVAEILAKGEADPFKTVGTNEQGILNAPQIVIENNGQNTNLTI